MLSPQVDLPALGDGETMGFSFWLYGDTPDTDGSGDNYLEDYYTVSIMDIDALAWQATSFDSYDGNLKFNKYSLISLIAPSCAI